MNDERRWRPTPVLGLLSAAILIMSVVVVYVRHDRADDATPLPARTAELQGHVPFAGTPASSWHAAATALTLPRAHPVGPYSRAEVAAALARARRYLLVARTGDAVLLAHRLSPLRALAEPHTPPTASHLYPVLLAPRNRLAAPVRVIGHLQVSFVAAHRPYAEHLQVSGNLIWAYALRAGYPVAAPSEGVVTRHEHVEFGFYRNDGLVDLAPQRDRVLTASMDCGYSHDGLLGLPRVDDPDAAPGSGREPAPYDLGASVEHGSGCLAH